MQQLHLVGFTTESDHLILSAKKGAKSGSFVVPLDERLLEVIADAVRRRNAVSGDDALTTPPELLPPPEPPKRTSLLSPREIQARLRAGRTIGQVAREAATEEDWVAKFAPPVLAERGRIITRVRDLVFTKPRRGESAEPLGLSVRWNLADRGVRLIDDEFDACWSAFHVGDTVWGITFEFVSRGRRQTAEWEVDLADDVLVARNRIAGDLAYIEPGRRRRLTLTPEPSDRDGKNRRGDGGAVNASPRTASKVSRASKASKASKGSKSSGKVATAPSTAAKAVRTSSSKAATKPASPARKSIATAKAAGAGKRVARTSGRAAKSARSTSSVAKSGRGAKRAARPRGPGPDAPSPAAAPNAPARPAPQANELARRRLEMVRAKAAAAPAAGKVAPRRASAPQAPQVREAPAARRDQPRAVEPRDRVESSPEAPAPTSQPAPQERAAPKPQERAPRARIAQEPMRQEPPERAARQRSPLEPQEPAASAPSAAEEAARARREERRRARAERLGQEPRSTLPSAQLPPDSAIPNDDGRVVTIRANRAGGGDVVVPGGPRPLRPAQPAAQPKRKRFNRSR